MTIKVGKVQTRDLEGRKLHQALRSVLALLTTSETAKLGAELSMGTHWEKLSPKTRTALADIADAYEELTAE